MNLLPARRRAVRHRYVGALVSLAHSALGGVMLLAALRIGDGLGWWHVERVELPRDGHLWAWTAVTHPPPGYEGEVPYGFGVVELNGIGLRIVTRLTEADPSRLHEGQRMTLVTDDLGDGVATWAFAPIPA